ncbi:MAG: hypothetical protein AMXMBFR84_05980 [Candidatus Hydrogenedentota bacterium]
MITREDKLWSAYLDGELSASEASEFDQTLTPAARERLSREMRFEKCIADSLSTGVRCPDDAWQRISESVLAQTPKKAKRKAMDWVWYGVTALAASLAIAVGLEINNWRNTPPDFLQLKADRVEDLQLQVAYETSDVEELSRFLKSNNVALSMEDPSVHSPRRHPRIIYGAREATYRGEEVMEVFFECCGQPAKIVVVPKGGAAAQAIGRAVANGKVKDAKPVGNFVAAIVSNHGGSAGMLEMLTPETEMASRSV